MLRDLGRSTFITPSAGLEWTLAFQGAAMVEDDGSMNNRVMAHGAAFESSTSDLRGLFSVPFWYHSDRLPPSCVIPLL